MKIIITENYEELSKVAADIISAEIKEKSNLTLGLATGSTPIGTYKELIDKYKKREISFKDVKSFNLDEYVSLSENDDQSYKYFMNYNFFNHIDIDKNNCFIPNGVSDNLEDEIARYDRMLEENNYTDIQILGIGENGHIAFNEPGEYLNAKTSIVKLKKETIEANSRFFEHIEDVPKFAISMGLKGIMSSKHIILLASGKNKSNAIRNMLSGKISTQNPSSLLNMHNNVTVILDKDAAELILRK